MKFKGHLMMGLIGLALVAAPITASAQNTDRHKYDSRPAQTTNNASASHSYREPTRSTGSARNVAPATENRNARSQTMTNAARDERAIRTQPSDTIHRDSREAREVVNRSNDRDYDHRDYDYRNYRNRDNDHRDYDGPRAEGYYVMPRGYAGGACAWARHLRTIYNQDRYEGHPAAAADLLPQLHRAERSCGGVPYGFLR
ncbi:MAG: hypothetical protein ACREQH_03185 [Candidatus Binatus sp.]